MIKAIPSKLNTCVNNAAFQKVSLFINLNLYLFNISTFETSKHHGAENSFMVAFLSLLLTVGVIMPLIKILDDMGKIPEIPGFSRFVRTEVPVFRATSIQMNASVVLKGISKMMQLNITMILLSGYAMSNIITTLLLIGKN